MAGEALTAPPSVLAVQDLAVAAPRSGRALLTGVTFSVAAGQTAVFLGANGAGKSSLFRVLGGLWPPGGGTLSGAAPEGAALLVEDAERQFLGGTVREELALGLEFAGLLPEEITARIAEASRVFDLETFLGRSPRSLSGGEQQRCLLASAWVRQPEILLLDDCFSHQSPGVALETWKLVCSQVRAGRFQAALLATQDADLAADADWVGVLAEGRLAGWGPPSRILHGELPEAVDRGTVADLVRELGLQETAVTPEALVASWTGQPR